MANGNAVAPLCQYDELTPDPSTTTSNPTPTETTSPPAPTTTSPVPECSVGWSQYEDRCYWVIMKDLNWWDAMAECQTLGADLASSHSDRQNAFLHSLVPNHDNTWLGGTYDHDETNWVWTDGTEFDWSGGWYYGEGGWWGQDCLALNGDTYLWYDFYCSHQLWAICSVEI